MTPEEIISKIGSEMITVMVAGGLIVIAIKFCWTIINDLGDPK